MPFPNDFGTIPANMQGTMLLADATDGHSLMHRQLGTIVNAAGSKLGLSSGTPSANQVLYGNGGGTAIWSSTINGMSLGTPVITSGTMNSMLLGTITQGGDALGDIYYRGNNGTLTRLAIGGTGQLLTVSIGTLPAWQTAAPNKSIMYQINPADGSATSNSFGTVSDGIGTVAITSGSMNVYVDAHANMFNSATNGISYMEVTANGSLVGQQGYVVGGTDSISNKAGGGTTLPVGTYVLAAQVKTSTSGTARYFQMSFTILANQA